MFPASTASPPNRLTPRYLGLLVRPFRLEPTPFLCAMSASAELDIGDADLGIALPMSGLAAIILPPLELEHVDLGFLAVPYHLGQNLGPADQWRACLDGVPVRGEQYFIEGHFGPRCRVHERKPQGLALFCPKLLTQCPEDRVHAKPVY